MIWRCYVSTSVEDFVKINSHLHRMTDGKNLLKEMAHTWILTEYDIRTLHTTIDNRIITTYFLFILRWVQLQRLTSCIASRTTTVVRAV